MPRFVVDRDLAARVQQHLNARNARPRPVIEGRPRLQIRAQADAASELLIYDEIGWFGVWAQDVVDALDGITGDLHVRINSPGGDVFDGIAIHNALAGHPGNVTVTVDGLAASAASFIAQAGDTITMNRGAQMMIHDAWGVCMGNAADMTEMAGLLDRLSDTIAGIYADRASGDVADWRTSMRAESWYNASEAIAAGLADVMAPSRHSKSDGDGGGEDEPAVEPDEDETMAAAASASYDLSVFIFAGRDAAPAPPMPAAKQGSPPVRVTAVGPHEGTGKEGTWDAGAQQGRLPSPMPVVTARAMYALYDGDRVEDGKLPKDACSLPHHFVSEDGTPGAPSLNGVHNALARLGQTQGYSDAEKATAERHLRGHLPADSEDHAEHLPAEHADTWWAAATAHLTQQTAPDNYWAAATAHLKGAGL
jgi:ATP-dependent protease ClpP protease subunit